MPDSTQNMSTQDSEGSNETPDRSLGSLSFTATGEQLDDIQVNLDRIFIDSPAPSSLLLTGDGPSSISGFGHTGSNSARRIQLQEPLQAISDNGDSQPQEPQTEESVKMSLMNRERFERLSLIDVNEVTGLVEGDNWLCDVPSELPLNFSEDDRSFLDTNLLNKRFSLLNYVTRAITEEVYAETRRHIPISAISNLANEPAGGGATYRVTRPAARVQSAVSRLSSGANVSLNGDSNRDINLSSTVNEGCVANLSANFSPIENVEEHLNDSASQLSSPRSDESSPRRISSGSLTYRRPPMQRQGRVSFNGQDARESPRNEVMYEPDDQQDESGFITGNYSQLGSRTVRLSHHRSSFPRLATGGLEPAEFIPHTVSPIAPAPVSRVVPPSTRNGSSPRSDANEISDDFDEGGGSDPRQMHGDDAFMHSGSHSREIDTRTYTRPKKTRMSLGTPLRQLNTTMTRSPAHSEGNQHHVLNTTMNLSHHSPIMGTPNRQLNTTIDLSPDRGVFVGTAPGTPNQLNTTIDLSSEKNPSSGATATPTVNLNETFVAENGETPGEKTRRVTRNLSYVIRREDEESPNNNSSPLHSNATSRPDLNNTFSYEGDGDAEILVARGSQNTSMEDLNSRVASQIRSLGCSTISRGRLSDQGIARANLDESRLVARTSSTDTYSVAHSSESPTSSGLSSPMDAQSYDDIQTSESVRRSMPNLAVIRGATNMRSNLAFPQAGGGQLRKNHYISDSRLSRLGSNERPRLSVHPSDSSHIAQYNRTLRPSEIGRPRGVAERNTSTPAALNRISSGLGSTSSRVHSASTLPSSSNSGGRTYRLDPSSRTQGSAGNVRSTGLAPPRYTTAATGGGNVGSGIRPPRPSSSNSSQSSNASRTSVPGIPVPTFRSQSRIPAPGQLRFSRPPSSASNRTGSNAKPPPSHKGPVDDWRDGCY